MDSRSSKNVQAPNGNAAFGRQTSADGVAYRFVKRAFDIIFSGAVTVVLAVPVAILGIAIAAESPGGPMFRQSRIGKGGKEIRIFKLRSMYSDAHACPEKYLDEGQLAQWRREQKVDNDPRVTKIGRFIRKTSIDELPQFLNVLMGDMSVVGPRPVTIEETYEFGRDRELALSVRPGITGLWQVTARNDATWESGERQLLELEYVRNRSVGMDLRIILGTFAAILKKTGK